MSLVSTIASSIGESFAHGVFAGLANYAFGFGNDYYVKQFGDEGKEVVGRRADTLRSVVLDDILEQNGEQIVEYGEDILKNVVENDLIVEIIREKTVVGRLIGYDTHYNYILSIMFREKLYKCVLQHKYVYANLKQYYFENFLKVLENLEFKEIIDINKID